jgi:biopolymer transport protein ExbD
MPQPPCKRTAIAAAVDMTPLIDIVFQLLIFFVMTFRFAEQETEFQIKFPRPGAGHAFQQTPLPPLRLALSADSQGQVAALRLNGETMANFAAVTERLTAILHQRELGIVVEKMDMELACSPDLKHSETVRAIDAVIGVRTRDGAVSPLVDQVRFVELR